MKRLMETGNADNRSLQRTALLVTTLDSFLTPMMASAVAVALPSIARDFAMNAVQMGWVASAYLLAAAAFLLPFGRLADIHGRKKVFTIGTLLFGAASLLAGLAPNAGVFLFARVLQGTGGAMVFGTSVAILTSVFPPQRRGWVLGINVAATYSGLSLGPFIGGLLTQYLGWRSVFLHQRPPGAAGPGRPLAEAAPGMGRLPRRTLRLEGLARLQPDADRLHARLHLAAGLARRRQCSWPPRPPLPLFIALGNAQRPPDLPGAPGPRQHRLRLLQPGGAGQLQRHLCHQLPAEPVPAVHQGLHPAHGRPGPDRPTRGHGPVLAAGGPAVRPAGTAGGGLAGHGPCAPPACSPLPGWGRRAAWASSWPPWSWSASASPFSPRPTPTPSWARSRRNSTAWPRRPWPPCAWSGRC